jgi:hypothetical protein
MVAKKVPIIQIGWHSYGKIGLEARALQLCEIRQMLSETHTMDYGLEFGWERWSLKKELCCYTVCDRLHHRVTGA